MSFVYWLARFSQEAILVEAFLISLLCVLYFGYLLILKRRYGAHAKNVPDNVVRAFLGQILAEAEGFKSQLFGQDFKAEPSLGGFTSIPSISTTSASGPMVLGGGGGGDNSALTAQLNASIAKQNELQQLLSKLTTEKSSLEGKLAEAGKVAPASAAGPSAADKKALTDAQEKITKLQAMLHEYEIIEDDLANLKRYQQENAQLKAQLAGTGGAALPAPAPAAATPSIADLTAPTSEPAAAPAPEPAAAAPAVEEAGAFAALDAAASAAASTETPAAVAEPAPAAAETTPTPATDAPQGLGALDAIDAGAIAAEPAPAPAPAGASPNDLMAATAPGAGSNIESVPAAGAAPAGDNKSDADLLSEFEKMLNG